METECGTQGRCTEALCQQNYSISELTMHALESNTLYSERQTIHMPGFSTSLQSSLCKKASNHHANLPLEMCSFTL